jgi:hypothetical protein
LPARFLDAANHALEDVFTLQGVTARQQRLSSGKFDWTWRGPNNDIEWAWFLNRLGCLSDLWRAYRKTGNIQYYNYMLTTLDDWITSNPAPRMLSFSPAWRPLEAARRLLYVWLPLLPAWQADEHFPNDLQLKLKQSLIEHGCYLRRHHALGGNHFITEMLALLTLAYAMPEQAEAYDWKAYALGRMDRCYCEQVYPDSVYKELSVHYHRIVAQNYMRLINLLTEAKDQEALELWKPRIEKLWSYMHLVAKPNGYGPLNNDSDLEKLRKYIRKQGPPRVRRQPLESCFYPWAGHAVFRGKETAHWSFFDLGARGTDHQHDDFMHVNLAIGHADFLVDCGRFTYEPGMWRDYFVGARAHNCVMLNGQACDQGPKQYLREPKFDARISDTECEVSGRARFDSSKGHCSGDWQRTFRYTVDQSWLVEDEMIAFGANCMNTYWHWHPDCVLSGDLLSAEGLIVRCGNEKLRVTLEAVGQVVSTHLSSVSGLAEPQPQGWYSEKFNQRVPAPVLVVEQRLYGAVRNIWKFTDLNL